MFYQILQIRHLMIKDFINFINFIKGLQIVSDSNFVVTVILLPKLYSIAGGKRFLHTQPECVYDCDICIYTRIYNIMIVDDYRLYVVNKNNRICNFQKFMQLRNFQFTFGSRCLLNLKIVIHTKLYNYYFAPICQLRM